MHAPCKISIVLLLLLCGMTSPAIAQGNFDSISRKPVVDLSGINGKLFDLPERDGSFYFRVDLSYGQVMMIRFGKLSYWQEGSVPLAFNAAAYAWKRMADSFKSTTSSRRLAVFMPRKILPLLVSMKEHESESKLLIVEKDRSQPFRAAMDTLSMLKMTAIPGVDTNSCVPILYIFLLKDMGDIASLTRDTELVNNISKTFDSLVASKRRQWKRQDARQHSLEAQYDLSEGISGTHKMKTTHPRAAMGPIEISGDLGATLIANNIAAYASARLYYKWADEKAGKDRFLGLSYSAINIVKEEGETLGLRRLGFLNLEIGALAIDKGSAFPYARTSIGMGYRVDAQDVGPYDYKYRMFFTYSPTRILSVVPEIYMIPAKNGQKTKGFVGISVSIRLI